MSKKTKEILIHVLLFVAIFVVPYSAFYYFESRNNEMFYSRIDQDNEKCYERAKRDLAYTEFCNQIESAAKETFRASRRLNGLYWLIFLPFVFVLVLINWQLRKEIAELKENIDA